MKVIVIGSNGQLGMEVMRACVGDKKNSYIFLSHKSVDITNVEQLRSELGKCKPNIVINCAAYTNVDKASQGWDDVARRVNIDGSKNLADTCKELDATLIHVSTDYVFDGKKNEAYKESDETNPLNVYGLTKKIGEEKIVESGCKYIILRTSWLYSSHHNNFFLTMKKLIGEGKELRVISDQIGTPTWAHDLAHAIVQIISEEKYDKQGVYHYSNEGVASWYDFACSIREYLKGSNKISPCTSEEYCSSVERPKFSVLDKSLFKKTFEQEIPYWRISLQRCINEEKNNTIDEY